jgi:predicted transcriptional regulator
MADIELLKQVLKDSGMTMVAIAEKSGIERTTLYNRLNGIGDFTSREIVGLTNVLHLTKAQRDRIFFV